MMMVTNQGVSVPFSDCVTLTYKILLRKCEGPSKLVSLQEGSMEEMLQML